VCYLGQVLKVHDDSSASRYPTVQTIQYHTKVNERRIPSYELLQIIFRQPPPIFLFLSCLLCAVVSDFMRNMLHFSQSLGDGQDNHDSHDDHDHDEDDGVVMVWYGMTLHVIYAVFTNGT
jgi:hypothetical protein